MPSTIDAPARATTTAASHGTTAKPAKRRGGRRSRGQLADGTRYFVGRPADGDGKPTLEQEVASEPEALVIAFKNDSRVYFVSEYRVADRIEGGQVRLEKETASSVPTGLKGFSTTNES